MQERSLAASMAAAASKATVCKNDMFQKPGLILKKTPMRMEPLMSHWRFCMQTVVPNTYFCCGGTLFLSHDVEGALEGGNLCCDALYDGRRGVRFLLRGCEESWAALGWGCIILRSFPTARIPRISIPRGCMPPWVDNRQ